MAVRFNEKHNFFVMPGLSQAPKDVSRWVFRPEGYITYDPVAALEEDPTCEEAKQAELKILDSHCPYDSSPIHLLREYQSKGVKVSLAKKGGILIADEMGLGKTIQALKILELKYKPHADKILIVTPASVLYNWRKEATKWLPVFMAMNTLEFVTYNTIHKAKGIYNCIIFDEAHYLKNAKSKRSKSAFALTRKVEGVIMLTGTPIPNRHLELLPILQVLNVVKGGAELIFKSMFCCDEYVGGVLRKDKGSKNSEALNNFLRSTCMVRRKKDEVLTMLPPKLRRAVYFELGVNGKKLANYGLNLNITLEKMKGLVMDSKGEIVSYLKELGVAKIPQIIAHIKEALDEEPKVIVFAWHKDVMHALKAEFPNCSYIDGSTRPEQRLKEVENFQNNPRCRVFIGNYRAAGEGITLTAAKRVILAEMYWSPSIMSQAEDRAHRIGQQSDVVVDYLIADGTLDTVVTRVALKKETIMTEAVGSTRTAEETKTEEAQMPIEQTLERVAANTEQTNQAITNLCSIAQALLLMIESLEDKLSHGQDATRQTRSRRTKAEMEAERNAQSVEEVPQHQGIAETEAQTAQVVESAVAETPVEDAQSREDNLAHINAGLQKLKDQGADLKSTVLDGFVKIFGIANGKLNMSVDNTTKENTRKACEVIKRELEKIASVQQPVTQTSLMAKFREAFSECAKKTNGLAEANKIVTKFGGMSGVSKLGEDMMNQLVAELRG